MQCVFSSQLLRERMGGGGEGRGHWISLGNIATARCPRPQSNGDTLKACNVQHELSRRIQTVTAMDAGKGHVYHHRGGR